MSTGIQDLDLKLKALEEAISYPKLREDKDTCMIEVTQFNYDIIRDQVQGNEKLTNLEGAKIEMLLEMLRLLSDNKIKYNIELHNHIVFYWRGLPIITIKVNNDNPDNQLHNGRMMYVSVKVYKDELHTYRTDRKISRVVAGTVGGLLILGGAIFAYSFFRSRSH